MRARTTVIAVAALVAAMLLCWVLQCITRNYSWVDRLWSVMPGVYAWIFALWNPNRSGRLVLMAVLVTAWCARQGVLADDVRVGRRSLEDVFLDLTGRELRS